MQLYHMSRACIDSKIIEAEPIIWDAHCVTSVSDHRVVMSENESRRVRLQYEDTHDDKARRGGGGQGG